jgi:hypothetical protein
MDCDVSGFDGTNTDTNLWDKDDLVGYDAANKFVYLFDGDSPIVAGNDVGNPDPITGKPRSPGYIGIRYLYYDSTHFVGTYTGKPTMATPSWRLSEPTTSTAIYNYVVGNGIAPNSTIPRDYRAIEAAGPFLLNAHDSMHIAVAWVVGDSLAKAILNSQVAQTMFDNGYPPSASAPDAPQYNIISTTSAGLPALALRWKHNAEQSVDPFTHAKDFAGYAVYRLSSEGQGGAMVWDTLAVYVKGDAVDPLKDKRWIGRPFLRSWPPATVVQGTDTLYELIDADRPNGLIYTYAITAFDHDTLGFGRLENQIGRGQPSTQIFMANAPAATTVNKIRVVPNPFMGSTAFNNQNPVDTNPWVNRIRFINLPKESKISIFTLAGDLVRTIHAGDIVYRNRDVAVTGDFSGVAEWDLTTKNNQEAVSGLYIYVVQSSAGTFTGKFVIMR